MTAVILHDRVELDGVDARAVTQTGCVDQFGVFGDAAVCVMRDGAQVARGILRRERELVAKRRRGHGDELLLVPVEIDRLRDETVRSAGLQHVDRA